jgi:hypothetical protein
LAGIGTPVEPASRPPPCHREHHDFGTTQSTNAKCCGRVTPASYSSMSGTESTQFNLSIEQPAKAGGKRLCHSAVLQQPSQYREHSKGWRLAMIIARNITIQAVYFDMKVPTSRWLRPVDYGTLPNGFLLCREFDGRPRRNSSAPCLRRKTCPRS